MLTRLDPLGQRSRPGLGQAHHRLVDGLVAASPAAGASGAGPRRRLSLPILERPPRPVLGSSSARCRAVGSPCHRGVASSVRVAEHRCLRATSLVRCGHATGSSGADDREGRSERRRAGGPPLELTCAAAHASRPRRALEQRAPARLARARPAAAPPATTSQPLADSATRPPAHVHPSAAGHTAAYGCRSSSTARRPRSARRPRTTESSTGTVHAGEHPRRVESGGHGAGDVGVEPVAHGQGRLRRASRAAPPPPVERRRVASRRPLARGRQLPPSRSTYAPLPGDGPHARGNVESALLATHATPRRGAWRRSRSPGPRAGGRDPAARRRRPDFSLSGHPGSTASRPASSGRQRLRVHRARGRATHVERGSRARRPRPARSSRRRLR